LDELFQDYFEKGITAEEIEGSEMIRDVKRQNFIPEDIEDLYEEALIKEYKRYFESRKK
jgi:non-homologous end joining protein Ku